MKSRYTSLRWSMWVALVLATIAGPAVAQNFRILDPASPGRKAPHDPPPFTHWDLREMPSCRVPWVMGTAPVIDLNNNLIANEPADRALAQGVFAAALNRWDTVLPSDLGFINTGAVIPYGGFVLDGYNTVIFDAVTLPQTIIAEVLTTSSASTGRVIEADVIFNSDPTPVPYYGVRHFVMQSNGTPLAADLDLPPYFNWPTPADGDTDLNGNLIQEHNVDLMNIAMHEFGHFVGLGHIEPLGGIMNDPANALMEQYWQIPLGPQGGGWANQTLKNPDRDGENFLYCPDLGDAPDPWMGVAGQYPTLVHRSGFGRHLNGLTLDGIRPGAEHILAIKPRQPARNWTYEWLGQSDNSNVDGECEANTVDLDPYDDGVTFYPNPPIWGRTLNVTAWVRTANDNLANAHNYLTTPLWLNSWIDLNQDGVWNPFLPEWFMNTSLAPTPLIGPNTVSGPGGTTSSVLLPSLVPSYNLPVWLRTRLDWGEDVGLAANIDSTLFYSAGGAQFGEVEDYPLWCNRRYEHHWVQYNQSLFNVQGVRNVYIGAVDASDVILGGVVDNNCCLTQAASGQYTVYGGPDETTNDFVMPYYLTIGQRMDAGKCRSSITAPPITLARVYWLSNEFTIAAISPPPAAIPYANRIPSVNVGYCLSGPSAAPTGMLVQVGAVDIDNGGYLSRNLTVAKHEAMVSAGEWNDTLRVTVSYRVAPGILPLQSLNPCDPQFAALTNHVVGSGRVTPEGGFTFPLSIPGTIVPGQSLIVQVESRWSTNTTVNNQLVEFPLPVGGPTTVDGTPKPKYASLESYPNPFNPSTSVRFALPKSETVTLAVFDVTGRLVRTLLHDARKPAGFFEQRWDGTDDNGKNVASGVYFLRLATSRETLTRKIVLMK